MSEQEICKDHCNGGVYFEDADCYVCNMLERIAELEADRKVWRESAETIGREVAALREQVTRKEAAIIALQDGCRALIADKDAAEAENFTLREQVARMPVLKGYVGSTTAELLSDTNWGLSKEWAINVAKERTNYYDTPIYIDPPADSGEG